MSNNLEKKIRIDKIWKEKSLEKNKSRNLQCRKKKRFRIKKMSNIRLRLLLYDGLIDKRLHYQQNT